MAKQTFTTGQVLTAAQVTALQTNDYNQTVTTQTTNYVLVAADVGTRVFMNAAGSTTITVNTGLFDAGDTLFLGNIGAGSCVVTAGTATVSKFSTASLTLSQYQGAYLYFVSTGVAILYSDSAGASTPLTTKGDLFGFSTLNARVPIGTNNQVLTADSAEALGLKWATASSGGMTLLNPGGTTLTSSSTAITGISGSYVSLVVFISGVNVSSNCNFTCKINSTTTTIAQGGTDNATAYSDTSSTHINLRGTQDEMKSGNADSVFFLQVDNYASTTFNKTFTLISRFLHPAGTVRTLNAGGSILLPSTAISSLEFVVSAGTFSAGTVLVYGVK